MAVHVDALTVRVIWRWVLILLGFLVTSVVGGKDLTREPETKGCEVVEACVDSILHSNIFPSDKEILRRIGYVESKDGTDRGTYREGYHGGIWQVDNIGFLDTQDVGAHPGLTRKFESIMTKFGIDWPSVVWNDLRKPLYSALASRLFLSNIAEALPNSADIDGQARYWKFYYNSDEGAGTEQKFIDDVHALQNSEDCSCVIAGADIAFVMDGSGSVGSSNFETAKQFVLDVATSFTIGAEETRIAVIQYSSSPVVEFDFDDYLSIDTLETAINGISYRSGGTQTGQAITSMVNSLFVDSGGARPSDKNIPRIGIVITDGRSGDDVLQPANNARAAAITMFAIGVGSYNRDELNEIANDPDSKFVFQVGNFDVIENIKSLLTTATCKVPIEVPIGLPVDIKLPPGATRHISQDVPPSRQMTVKISASTGEVIAYLSTVIPTPSAAFYQWKMETTSTQRYVERYIDLNDTEVGSSRRKRRQLIESDQMTLFFAIENKSTGNGTDQIPADINTIAEEGNTLILTTASSFTTDMDTTLDVTTESETTIQVKTDATTQLTTRATTHLTTRATTHLTTRATTHLTTRATTNVTTKATTHAMTTVQTTPMESKRPPNYGVPLPSPEYPDHTEYAEKIIRIDIKVLDVPVGCDPLINTSSKVCEQFKEDFIDNVELAYKAIAGFGRVDIVNLLSVFGVDGIAGEIIVEHEVIYIWNDMDSSDRGLTADEIYAMTVADDIEKGSIGNNLTVEICPECTAPQETTPPLCTNNDKITCGPDSNTGKYLDPYCIDGLPVCMSMCLNTDPFYCDSEHGICIQENNQQAPECNCERTSDYLYYGTRCRQSLNKIWLYLGVALSLFLIVLTITALLVCLVISKKKNGKSTDSKNTSDEIDEVLGVQNYGHSNEVYDPLSPDVQVFHAVHHHQSWQAHASTTSAALDHNEFSMHQHRREGFHDNYMYNY